MLPPSLDDWLPANHLARFIAEIVEQLDLSEIYRAYEKDGRGQAAYHPLMMVKLLLYGYCVGVNSSRKMERATYDSVAFRYLAANQHPDHTVIAEFRRRHLVALGRLFFQALKLCQAAGLVKLGHVALDGTKMAANASLYKNRTYEKLTEREKQLAAEVDRMLSAAEQADATDDEKYGRGQRGDELPADLADKQNRLDKIRAAKARLEQEAKEKAEEEKAEAEERLRQRQQREAEAGRRLGGRSPQPPTGDLPDPKAKTNLTDPDSALMKRGSGPGFVQGYNAQTAVDNAHQIIVAADVIQQGHDRAQLARMIEQVIENTGAIPAQVSADTGYYSPTQIADPRVAGIDLYIPPDEPPKKNAGEGADSDGGANPAVAEPNETGRRKRKPRSGYNAEGVPRIDAMRQKLATPEGKQAYAKRRETVEPVFGQIKFVRGLRRFLLRGAHKVRAEWNIICLGHNLLKLFRATAMA